MLCFETCLVNIVFVETNLIVYWSIVHLEQRDVIFVGELVKVPVGDNLPDLSVDVAVSFVGVEHMILPNPHQEVTGGNVLTMEDTNNSKFLRKSEFCFPLLAQYLHTMSSCDDPAVGEQSCSTLVLELATLVLSQ